MRRNLNACKKLSLILAVLCSIFSVNAQWATGGPTGATGSLRENCLTVRGGKIFAGTSKGVYVSADSGVSWTPLTSTSPGPGTNAIEAIHAASTGLFVSTTSNVYVSTNDGATWTSVKATIPNGVIILEFTSIGSSVFAVGQGSGIYKTTNNGTNWTLSNSGSTTLPYHICTNGTNLYVGSHNNVGVYMSTNQGTSWTAIGGPVNGPGYYPVYAIAAMGSYVYIGTSNNSVHMTSNAGTTWTQVSNGIATNSNIHALAVLDTTSGVCTGSVFASGNSGTVYMAPGDVSQWTAITGNLPTSGYVWAMAFMGKKMFVQNTGNGVYQRDIPSTSNTLTPPVITPGKTAICSAGDSTNICSSTAGYTGYKWSNGSTSTCITAKQAGTYTVTVNDANGCTAASNNVTITSNTITPPVISAGRSILCGASDSIQICSGTNYSSYKWSNGNATSKCVYGKQAGSYTLTVTDGNGCTAQSNQLTFTSSNITAPVITAGKNALCPGSDSTQICPNGTYTSYKWSSGPTTNCLNAKQSGSYTLSVTDANGCTAQSNQLTITTATITSPTITAGKNALCAAQDSTQICPNGTYTSYKWSSGPTTNCLNAKQSGSYTLTVTDANGCTAQSNQVTITPSPSPTTTITNPSSSFCPGDSVQVCAASGFTSYRWNTGVSDNCLQIKQSGTYYVEITDGGGCAGESNHITVTSYTAPTPVVSGAGGKTALCGGGDSLQVCTDNTYASYVWNVSGSSQCIQAKTAGTYYVNVTDGNGCKGESNHLTLTTQTVTKPVVSAENNATIFCSGDSLRVCTSPTTYVSYQWNAATGNSTNECAQARGPGNYYVTATDANGCTAESNRLALSIYPVQPISIIVKGDTLSSSGAQQYSWYKNGILQQSGPDSIFIYKGAGSYTLRITDKNGCTVSSNPLVITGIEDIQATASFELYPNPATATVQLVVSDALLGSRLQMHNITGQLLSTMQLVSARTSIDVSAYPVGIYTLSLQNGSGVVTKKLLVTK